MFINIYENTASFDPFAEMCDKYTHTQRLIIIIKKTLVEKLHTVRFLKFMLSNVNVVVSNRPNGGLLTSGTAPAEILGH